IVAWGREHYSGSYIRVPDVVVTAVALYGGDWAGGLAILEDGGLIEFDLRSTSYRRVAPDYFAHKVFTTTQSDPYVYADLKKTFSFKGAVYDAWAKVNQGRDVPVPYAKVSVGEYLVECDENGEFAIESPTSALAIQDGTPLLVNVRADGYTNRSKIVEAKKIGMKVKIRLWPSNTY
ncbi:MAG: hypothetical protein PHW82_13985, partial [Bacteroidales bacterium]|nr:hypothetical protein [Bacteroidales bacterium]